MVNKPNLFIITLKVTGNRGNYSKTMHKFKDAKLTDYD